MFSNHEYIFCLLTILFKYWFKCSITMHFSWIINHNNNVFFFLHTVVFMIHLRLGLCSLGWIINHNNNVFFLHTVVFMIHLRLGLCSLGWIINHNNNVFFFLHTVVFMIHLRLCLCSLSWIINHNNNALLLLTYSSVYDSSSFMFMFSQLNNKS